MPRKSPCGAALEGKALVALKVCAASRLHRTAPRCTKFLAIAPNRASLHVLFATGAALGSGCAFDLLFYLGVRGILGLPLTGVCPNPCVTKDSSVHENPEMCNEGEFDATLLPRHAPVWHCGPEE